ARREARPLVGLLGPRHADERGTGLVGRAHHGRVGPRRPARGGLVRTGVTVAPMWCRAHAGSRLGRATDASKRSATARIAAGSPPTTTYSTLRRCDTLPTFLPCG